MIPDPSYDPHTIRFSSVPFKNALMFSQLMSTSRCLASTDVHANIKADAVSLKIHDLHIPDPQITEPS